MKKLFAALTMVLALSTAVSAAETAAPGRITYSKTYPFLLGIVPTWPRAAYDYDTCGLKLGAPTCSGTGTVYGVEASIFYCGTEYIKGVQATLAGFSRANMMRGIQACAGGCLATNLEGFQGSVINFAIGKSYGWQAAVASYSKEFTGFQSSIVNIADGELIGFQFGGVNVATEDADGCQIGIVNTVSGESMKGCQVGVVNVSSKKGFQIGFVNVIPNGPLPVMLIFNCAF